MGINVATRKVRETGVPGVRQSADIPPAAVGGAAARALTGVGEAATSLGKATAQIEQIEAREAEKKAIEAAKAQEQLDKSDATNAFILYDDTLRTFELDAKSRLGLGARDMTPEFTAKHNESFTKIRSSLTSPRSQEILGELAIPRRRSYLRTVSGHQLEQTKIYKINSMEAFGNNSVRSGISGAIKTDGTVNDEVIGTAETNIDLAANAQAEVQGWSNQEKIEYQTDKVSQLQKGVVENLLIQDAETANEYYNKNKEKIAGDQHDELESKINTALLDQQSTEAASTIFVQEDDFKKQYEQTLDIKDDELRVATRKKLDGMQKDKVARENRDAAIVSERLREDINSQLELPTVTREDLATTISGAETATERRELTNYVNAELAKKEKKEPIITDDEHLGKLQTAINNNQIASLSDLRVKAAGKIGPSDMKNLEKSFANGGTLGGLEEGKIVNAYRLHMNEHPDSNQKRYQAARRYIEDQVVALPPGRQMNSTELYNWMGEALIKGHETETLDKWFKSEKETTLSEALETGTAFTVIVPEERKEPITKELKALGIEVNDKAIQEYYLEFERGIEP